MPISAEIVRSLHPYDIRILLALERLMKRYQWVPEDILKKSTRFSESELSYRLAGLLDLELAKSSSVPYKGYHLTFFGYDTLALLTLTRKGSVQALGALIGEGKESVVYEGLGFGPVVLKFHRVGQRSFITARKTRGYLPDYGHFPWIFVSTRSAQQEFEALKRLHPAVRVPVPVDANRNVIVMSQITGPNLHQCTVSDPQEVLSQILDAVSVAYRLGVIHGDLSEFNVMVDEEGAWIIDWPQWIPPDHPNADVILRRDIEHIITYFDRKYGIEQELDKVVSGVMG
jgi:RIO kinase 2